MSTYQLPANLERNVTELLLRRAEKTPDAPAIRSKINGEWRALSWKQLQQITTEAAYGFISLGANAGDRIAIVSQTREEWLISDLGIVGSGAATVTVYPSNLPDQVEYILTNSGSKIAVLEDQSQLDKIYKQGGRAKFAGLEKIVLISGQGDGDWVIGWKDLLDAGRKLQGEKPGLFKERVAATGPESLACLIYTSGTTGNPKGVMTPHRAFTFGSHTVLKSLPIGLEDEQLLFLPLAHSFAKMMSIILMKSGAVTTFAEGINKAVDNMAEVRPTFMAAVPRIFEKVAQKVIAGAEQAGGAKLKIFRWALEVGKKRSTYVLEHRSEPGGLLGLQYRLAHKLVYSKLHARFGGRLKYFVSGGAPLSKDIAEFFHAFGVDILEGFGMTETNSITCVNRPGNQVYGTIGELFEGVEAKLASDGELLIRGPMLMQGYWSMPEETKETLAEGWLHTGDIAEIDAKGFIKITDRKKDLIKTAGGKFVAPQRIEGLFKTSPFISQAAVSGDQKPYCVALITLNEENIPAWATQQGITFSNVAELSKNPQVRKLLEGIIGDFNKQLASFEQIKKFEILPEDFTVENGILTPSLKVKRKEVVKKYGAVIEQMYATGGAKGE
jgi:long-chain acyl-CoA synthetase